MFKTIEQQRDALARPVHPKFIQQSPQVKGDYTTIDYVRYVLNSVFGPDNWSSTILDGPSIEAVNEKYAYARVTIRLTCQFANGQQVIHDDVGVWPLSAGAGTLDATKPERFETVLKAAVSDGIKACAEYLGPCFRPLTDETVLGHIIKKGAVE